MIKTAVIQAGGRGTRLRPYTLVVPKPIIPIGDQAILEVLLKWLRRWGISKVYITVGYLGHLIRALCGNGSQWDIDITYSEETEPLGTIGPLLPLRDHLTERFLVLNGDLITDLNLHNFTSFHEQNNSIITIASTKATVKINFGVLETGDTRLIGFREKPQVDYQVSMGIYCMEPEVLQLIPRGVPFGFDDLLYTTLRDRLPVRVFTHEGLWIDVGQIEHLSQVQKDFLREHKVNILGA